MVGTANLDDPLFCTHAPTSPPLNALDPLTFAG